MTPLTIYLKTIAELLETIEARRDEYREALKALSLEEGSRIWNYCDELMDLVNADWAERTRDDDNLTEAEMTDISNAQAITVRRMKEKKGKLK